MKLNLVKEYITKSPQDLGAVVLDLQKLFKKRSIVLLEGPVGAGKTETIKALTKSLGLTEVASPSFAIHHHYKSKDGATQMDHLDLYRLESEDDLESTGFWDLFGEPEGLVVIEWADRLNQDLLPLNWHKIKVEISLGSAPTERQIKILQTPAS